MTAANDRTGPSYPSDRRARAVSRYEALLADELDAKESEQAFEALVAAHPELAQELREIHGEVGALAGVRDRIAATEGFEDDRVVALLDRLTGPRALEDRYELGRELGAGGQGRVLEAYEHGLRRRVAIKLPRDGVAASPAAGRSEPGVARLLTEAQVMAQLDHPGVVAVHELGVDAKRGPYFSMARIEGDDLREAISRIHDPRDAEWTRVRGLQLLVRVCETVAFAHTRGVLHRDLKPSNVMVGAFGEVYVVDWGLARVVAEPDCTGDGAPARAGSVTTLRERVAGQPVAGAARDATHSLTGASGRVGTLHYLAPEVACDGSAEASERSDVYALGAMLYELLSGAPPHHAELRGLDRDAAIARVVERAPAPLGRDVPAELVAITQRAMARGASNRYASAQELAEDLRAYLEQRVVRAYVTGPWAELVKWVARNRRLAFALAACALAVAGGLAAIAALEARARVDLDREADLYRAPYLEERAAALWPEVPEQVPALEAWILDAERLVSRRALQAAALAELRRRGEPQPDGTLRFARAEDGLRYEAVAATLERIDSLALETGLLADVRERLSWASTVEQRTIDDHADQWAAASTRVADPDGRYGATALELAPILGLVPLGPDPVSRLEEFAFARSGAVPLRDDEGGLVVNGGTAAVFVLVPGGDTLLGAQRDDESAPRFDAGGRPEESPVHTQRLDPYLVSKFELTQGQWRRLGGEPASFVRDEAEGGAPDAHPVEGVSWNEALAQLARHGMTLPTEAQWEHAARGGADGPFLGGDARALAGAVNLADRTVLDAGLGWPQAHGMEWLDDGFVRHAPVGSFRANGFGLHDALGNVWEWCLDAPVPFDEPAEAGTGLRGKGAATGCVARGGGFINNAAFARVTIRDTGRSRDFDSSYHGVRPALRIAR